MQSVCVTKAKAYYIIADGYTECYTFKSREEAESFIAVSYTHLTLPTTERV